MQAEYHTRLQRGKLKTARQPTEPTVEKQPTVAWFEGNKAAKAFRSFCRHAAANSGASLSQKKVPDRNGG